MRRRLHPDVYLLALLAALVRLGFGIIAPALPYIGRQFGAGSAEISLGISAFAFFRLLAAPPCGWLIDRYGERKVLLVGLFIQSVTTFAAGLAPTFGLLLFLRAIGGLGSGAFTIAALTLVMVAMRSGSSAEDRVVSVRAAVPEDRNDGGQHAGDVIPPHMRRSATRSSAFKAAAAVNFGGGWMIYGVRCSLVPLCAYEVLDKGAGWLGFVLLGASVLELGVLGFAAGLSDRWGRRPMMIVGSAGSFVTAVIMMMTPGGERGHRRLVLLLDGVPRDRRRTAGGRRRERRDE